MTRFATSVGTPVDDINGLEFETGLSFEELRLAAFGMANTIPGDPKKWSNGLFLKALNEAGSLHGQFKVNRRNII